MIRITIRYNIDKFKTISHYRVTNKKKNMFRMNISIIWDVQLRYNNKIGYIIRILPL